MISIEVATDRFLSAHGNTLRDNESETIPVPVRRAGQVELLIMVYHASARAGRPPAVSPPHAAARIHALTGAILAFAPCTPASLGITRPGDRPWPPRTEMVPGANVVELSRRMRRRLSDISPTLYAAFAARSPTAPVRGLAREFYHLIRELVLPEVSPFYDQAAREFFDYLRSA